MSSASLDRAGDHNDTAQPSSPPPTRGDSQPLLQEDLEAQRYGTPPSQGPSLPISNNGSPSHLRRVDSSENTAGSTVAGETWVSGQAARPAVGVEYVYPNWSNTDEPQVMRDVTHELAALSPLQEELTRLIPLHAVMSMAESTSSPVVPSLTRVGSSTNTWGTLGGAGGGGVNGGTGSSLSPASAPMLHTDPTRGLTPSASPNLMASPALSSTSNERDTFAGPIPEKCTDTPAKKHVHNYTSDPAVPPLVPNTKGSEASPDRLPYSPPIPISFAKGDPGKRSVQSLEERFCNEPARAPRMLVDDWERFDDSLDSSALNTISPTRASDYGRVTDLPPPLAPRSSSTAGTPVESGMLLASAARSENGHQLSRGENEKLEREHAHPSPSAAGAATTTGPGAADGKVDDGTARIHATSAFTVTNATGSHGLHAQQTQSTSPADSHCSSGAAWRYANSPGTPCALTSPSSGSNMPASFLPRSASTGVVPSSGSGPLHPFTSTSANNSMVGGGGSAPRYSARRSRRPAPPIDLSRSSNLLDRSQSLSTFGTPVYPISPLHNASGGVVPTVPAFHRPLGELPRAQTSCQLGDVNDSSAAGGPAIGEGLLSSARSTTSLLSGRSGRQSHRTGRRGCLMGATGAPASLKELFPGLPDSLLISRGRLYVPRDGHKRLGKGAYGEVLQAELYPPGVEAPTNPETPADNFLRSSQVTTPHLSHTSTQIMALSTVSPHLPITRHESSATTCTTPGVSPTSHNGANFHVPVHLQPYSDATADFYNGGIYTSDRDQLNSALISPTTQNRSVSAQALSLPSPVALVAGGGAAAARQPGTATFSGSTSSVPAHTDGTTRSSWDTVAVLIPVPQDTKNAVNREEDKEVGGRRGVETDHADDVVLGRSPDTDNLRRRTLTKESYLLARSPVLHSATVAPMQQSMLEYPSPSTLAPTADKTGSPASPLELKRCSSTASIDAQERISLQSLAVKQNAAKSTVDAEDGLCDRANNHNMKFRKPGSGDARRSTNMPNLVLGLVEAEADDDDFEIVNSGAAEPPSEVRTRGITSQQLSRRNGSFRVGGDDEDERTLDYQSPTNGAQSRSFAESHDPDKLGTVSSSVHHDEEETGSPSSLLSQSNRTALHVPSPKGLTTAAGTPAADGDRDAVASPAVTSRHSRDTTAPANKNRGAKGHNMGFSQVDGPFPFDTYSSDEESDLDVVGSTANTFDSPAASITTSGFNSRRQSFRHHVSAAAVPEAHTGNRSAEASLHPPETDLSATLSPKKPQATVPLNHSPDSSAGLPPGARSLGDRLSFTEAPHLDAIPTSVDKSPKHSSGSGQLDTVARASNDNADRNGSGDSDSAGAAGCDTVGKSVSYALKGSMPSLDSTSNALAEDSNFTDAVPPAPRHMIEKAATIAAAAAAISRFSAANPLGEDNDDENEEEESYVVDCKIQSPAIAVGATSGAEFSSSDEITPRRVDVSEDNDPANDGVSALAAALGGVSPNRDFGQTVSTEASFANTQNTFNMSFTGRGFTLPQHHYRNDLAEFPSTANAAEESIHDIPPDLPSSSHPNHDMEESQQMPTMSNIIDAVAAGAIPFRSVAVKTFVKSDLNRREFAQSFHNEMTIASQLQHPCLMNVFGIAEEADRILLVMDLAEKGNVDHYMKTFGVADTREMAPRFVADVVLLLEYFRDGRRHPYKPNLPTGAPQSLAASGVDAPTTPVLASAGGGTPLSRRPMRQEVPPVLSAASDALVGIAANTPESGVLAASRVSAQAVSIITPSKSESNSGVLTARSTPGAAENLFSLHHAHSTDSYDNHGKREEGATGEEGRSSEDPPRGSLVVHESSLCSAQRGHLEENENGVDVDEGNESDNEESDAADSVDTHTEASLPELSEEERFKSIVVHRDIKPDNMLLTWDYHVKLGDFGSACFLGDEEANRFGGTPAYIAPEVLLDSKAGPYTDLWALGCVVYELTVGHPAFRGATQYLITRQIKSFLKGEFQLPFDTSGGNAEGEEGVVEGVSEAAKDLVLKLLVAKPEDRLGSEEQGGFEALKRHPFFDGVDWSCVLETSNITPTNTNYTEELTDYLQCDEKVMYCSPVDLLKDSKGLAGLGLGDAGKSLMLSRRAGYCPKVLVLTDQPRLFLVDPGTCDVAFTIPWSRDLLAQVERTEYFAVYAPSCGRFHFLDRNRRADLWGIKISEQLRKPVKSPVITPRAASVDYTSRPRSNSMAVSRSQLNISLASIERDLNGNTAGSVMSHNGLINRIRLTPRSGHVSQPRSSHHRQHSASFSSASAVSASAAAAPPALQFHHRHSYSTGGSAINNYSATAPTCGLGCITDCTGRPHTARAALTTATAAAAAAAAATSTSSAQPLRSPSTMTVTVASTSNTEARLGTPATLVSPHKPRPIESTSAGPPPISNTTYVPSSIKDSEITLGSSFSSSGGPFEGSEGLGALTGSAHHAVSLPPSMRLTPTKAALTAAAHADEKVPGRAVSALKSLGDVSRAGAESAWGGGSDSCFSECLTECAEHGATPWPPSAPTPVGPEEGTTPTLISSAANQSHAKLASSQASNGSIPSPPPLTPSQSPAAPSNASTPGTGNSTNAINNSSSRSTVAKEVFQRRKKNRSVNARPPDAEKHDDHVHE